MGGGASQPQVEQLVLDAPKGDLCAAWQELPEEHQRLLRLALARAEKAEGGKVHSAFVFIKPHAVGVKVENLVREKLVAAGLTVRSEGDIEAKEIDEQRLIDQPRGPNLRWNSRFRAAFEALRCHRGKGGAPEAFGARGAREGSEGVPGAVARASDRLWPGFRGVFKGFSSRFCSVSHGFGAHGR